MPTLDNHQRLTRTVARKLLITLLDYNRETGLLFWKERGRRRTLWKPAGYVAADRYIRINFRGYNFYAHRLIWEIIYERAPEKFVDHIDRNPSNNRIENLRDVSMYENMRNSDNSLAARWMEKRCPL